MNFTPKIPVPELGTQGSILRTKNKLPRLFDSLPQHIGMMIFSETQPPPFSTHEKQYTFPYRKFSMELSFSTRASMSKLYLLIELQNLRKFHNKPMHF